MEADPTDSSDEQGARGRRSRWQKGAEWVVLVMLVVAPLARGAVDTPVLLALAGAGAVAYALLVRAQWQGEIRLGWFALALFTVTLASALQLVPLPEPLLSVVAPTTRLVLEYSQGKDALSSWHPVSLDPSATARELAKALGWVAAFLVLQHRARSSPRARKRALTAVAGTATAVAVIGLGHFLVGAEALFGLFRYAVEVPLLTTFGGANNLAGFLGAGSIVAFGLAADTDDRRRRLWWAVAGLTCALGTLLTQSVGGIGALLLGGAVLFMLRLRPPGRARDDDAPTEPLRSWMMFGAAALVVLAPLVVIYGGFNLTRVRETLDLEILQSKIEPARVGVAVARSQPLIGTGLGTFETVHPRFLSGPMRVTFTHVENEPIQAFAELGLVFGGLLVFAVLAAAINVARAGRRTAHEAGAAGAAMVLLSQSLADFGLHYATGLVLLTLLATPLRRTTVRIGRVWSFGIATASLLGIGAAVPTALQSAERDDAAMAQRAMKPGVSFEEVEAAAREALSRHPADYLPAETTAIRALSEVNGAHKALPWLNRLLFLNPFSGRAHEITAEAMARLGRREQALAEYRQAAELGADVMPRVLARYPDPDTALGVAPLEPALATMAARHLHTKGRLEDAIVVLERSHERSPAATEPLDLLTQLLELANRTDRALEVAHARRLSHPDDPHAWVMEANVLSTARNTAARNFYQEALQLFPENPEIVFAMAWHSLTHGEPQQALNDLVALPPDLSPDRLLTYHSYRGHALRLSFAHEEARGEYQLALLLYPERTDLWLALAATCLQLGAINEAETALSHVGSSVPGAESLRSDIAERARSRKANRWEQLLGQPPVYDSPRSAH